MAVEETQEEGWLEDGQFEIRVSGHEALLTPLARIRALGAELGHEPSLADYRELRREDPSLPSLTVLYHLVGPWPEVVKTAGVAAPASPDSEGPQPQALRAYEYRAVDEEGLWEEGQIAAPDVTAARAELENGGLDVALLLPLPPEGDRSQWSEEEMMDYVLDGMKAMQEMDVDLAALKEIVDTADGDPELAFTHDPERRSGWRLSRVEWVPVGSEDEPGDEAEDGSEDMATDPPTSEESR